MFFNVFGSSEKFIKNLLMSFSFKETSDLRGFRTDKSNYSLFYSLYKSLMHTLIVNSTILIALNSVAKSNN